MIDFYATQVAYMEHLRPVWDRIPTDMRGTFWTGTRILTKVAQAAGLDATLGSPRMPGPPVVVAGYSDVLTPHPARPVAYLEHGAGQTYSDHPWHPSYPGGAQRGRVGLFLVPGPRSAVLESAAYPNARVEIVGCPRLDTVVRWPGSSHPDAPLVVAFAWHWDCPIVPESRWAWPAWREPVKQLAASGDFTVIGTAHPRQAGTIAKWYAEVGIEYVRDANEVLGRADVVCFDNTSLGFEAMACGLGVVGLNAPWYRPNVTHGLRFWELPRIQIPPTDALPGYVELAELERVQSMADSFSIYPEDTRGCAAMLAASAIIDWNQEAHRG